MIQLSVVIITKNEERNIGRCLDSVKDVADEIIVIDSFSIDKTEEICKKYAEVRFFQRPWDDNYANAKNYGVSQASYDFILSLDADELLSKALKDNLLALKANAEAKAYTFNRLTNYCGSWIHHCGWYPDKVLRLWDRRVGQWEGSIHEKVVIAQSQNVKHIKGDILHYSFYSITDHLKKIQYYTELMARQNIKKGKKATYLKILFSPLFKFIQSYFFEKGFLDGYHGFVICLMSAYATFLKYVRTKELVSKTD